MFRSNYDFPSERRTGFDDMVFMSKFGENEINENLRSRFLLKTIYTYIGPVLISVNPQEEILSCQEEKMSNYRGASTMDKSPSVFAVGEEMFRNMLIDGEKQSLIITGESGAGKTSVAKFIVFYLGRTSADGSNFEKVKNVVLHSNPLLEAFGNAKTIRNENSSRFGKFLEIRFSPRGQILSGFISNFLLEKSRVVHQTGNERNFHIFYQILSSKQLNENFQIFPSDRFHFLADRTASECIKNEDFERFRETQRAMEIIGLSRETQNILFGLIVGILQLGNIRFSEKENCAVIDSAKEIEFCCSRFGIGQDELKKKLVSKRLEFKEEKENKGVEQKFTVEKSIFSREALAKSIFGRIFEFLIQSINEAFGNETRSDLSIGILDIYGFESLTENNFEQFCINYVNEKLHHVFIELTLKREQEEYHRESIRWNPIPFVTNTLICDLFDEKQPPGIFFLLDDVCASSHAATEKVDRFFLQKISNLNNPALQINPPTFTIRHYAASVVYHSDQFCQKNRDLLHNDLIDLMKTSKIPLVKALFPEQTANIKSRPTTGGTKIRQQTALLIEKLLSSQTNYIRCIKPNFNQRPAEWDSSCVLEQIRYLGLVATIHLRKYGFVYRKPYESFVNRYAVIIGQRSVDPIEGAAEIVRLFNFEPTEVQFGKRKIFIRSPESLHLLDEMRNRKFDHYARVIQRTIKRFASRKRFYQHREKASKLFMGRKERRSDSLNRDYLFDYCAINERANLRRLIPGFERIRFSSFVFKYDRRFRRQNRFLVITDDAVYIIIQEHVKLDRQESTLRFLIRRRILIECLQQIQLSEYCDNFFVIGVKDEYSTLLELSTKTEAIYVMTENYRQKTHRELPLNFGQNFDFPIKKQGWTGTTNRTIRFVHGATGLMMKQFEPAKLKKRDDPKKNYDLKISGQTMTVLTKTGLPKDSLPERPSIPEISMKRREKFLNKNDSICRRSIVKLVGLYTFQGRTEDELSFEPDEILLLLDDSHPTWWRVALNGKVGLVPSNYVERIDETTF